MESNPDPNSRRFSVPWNKDVIYVVGAPKIDTADIINAQFQELTAKTSGIVLVFTTNGEKKWNDLTAAHYGKRIAVVVDQRLLCLPVLRSNRSQAGPLLISGTFSPDEARRIASGINANWKKKSR